MSVIEINDWAWNCPGQFMFSATVSLPDSIEGNQDIASVRSLDWGEPRILQLGIRKKADQFTTWHVLMVGVRGQATDNRDYYHEMDVQQVSPGMHMHITLTVELPLDDSELTHVRVRTTRVLNPSQGLHHCMQSFEDMPRLFHGPDWTRSFPRLITPWRSELLSRPGKATERVDHIFTGKVHAYAARFQGTRNFPKEPQLSAVAIAEFRSIQEDLVCKATFKLPRGPDCATTMTFRQEETVASFLELIIKLGQQDRGLAVWQGPYGIAAAKELHTQAYPVDMSQVYEVTFEQLMTTLPPGANDGGVVFYLEVKAQIE